MGLFSAIKRAYYNSKLQKADKEAVIGNYYVAEISYVELISNHPEAVTKLAKLFFEQALNKNDNLDYYKKALDCRAKLVNRVSNSGTYYELQADIIKKIFKVFSDLNSDQQYEKALTYMLVLLQYRNDLKYILGYHQCLLDYAKFLFNSDSEKAFKIIDLFYSDALTRSLPKDFIPNSLIDIYKFQLDYARNLRFTHRENADKIIEGVYINSMLKTVPKDFIQKTLNEILTYAKEYADLGSYEQSNNLCKLILQDNYKSRVIFIENSIRIISYGKSSQQEITKLLNIINYIEDKNVLADYFSQLLGKVPEATEEYVKVILEIADREVYNLHYDKAVLILIEGNEKQEDFRLCDKLNAVAYHYIATSDYKSAVKILDQLIDKHADAQSLLARCYLRLSEATSSVDEKYKLLIKGFNFAKVHSNLFNNSLYQEYYLEIVTNLLNVAIKYAEYGYYSDAYNLLDILFNISPSTIDVYIKIKLIEANDKSDLVKKIDLLNETIYFATLKLKHVSSDKRQLIDKVFIELINSTILKVSNSEIDLIINELAALDLKISKEELSSKEFQAAYKALQNLIANSYYKKGVNFEKELEVGEAIKCYEIILNQFNDVKLVSSLALGRKCICYLKKQDTYNIKIIIETIHSYLLTQKEDRNLVELSYRYTIYLLKEGKFSVAEPIIDEFLSTKTPADKLKQICNNERIRYGLKCLEEYNQKIQSIDNDILPFNVALKLFLDLEEIEERISSILYDTKGAFVKSKSKVQNYILRKYFEAGAYWNGLSFLKENYRDYYKDERLFHNAAIAALGVVTMGQLNSVNYMKTISIWLTAIYSNMLFVRSLDYTVWDDNFSFSLVDSLGSLNNSDIKELPKNINFEAANEINISIGDVQRSLLVQFEEALTKGQYSDTFIAKAFGFYESEKDAISALYGLNLDNGCFACTPYFSENKKDVHNSIANALNNKFDNLCFDSDKDALLKVGLFFKVEGKRYKQYSEAKILMAKGVEVAAKMQLPQIRLIFTATNVDMMKQFDKLYTSFCSEIKDCLAIHIKKENNYEIVIANFLIICSSLSDVNLNFMLSNFANQVCVSKLNDDLIVKSKGLEILSSVFLVINDNVRLNKNLQSILDSASIEAILEGDQKLLRAVCDLLTRHTKHFEKQVIDALEKNVQVIVFSGKSNELISLLGFLLTISSYKSKINAIKSTASVMQVDFDLHELVEKLNNGKITALQGLQETFDLYKLHKEHQRLCDNLVILCGNVIQSDVMESTLKTSQICSLLDNICQNKSSTFNTSASQLATQRRSLLNSLPPDIRYLIESGYSNGVSLNPSGVALKKGLEYLKRLSD